VEVAEAAELVTSKRTSKPLMARSQQAQTQATAGQVVTVTVPAAVEVEATEPRERQLPAEQAQLEQC